MFLICSFLVLWREEEEEEDISELQKPQTGKCHTFGHWNWTLMTGLSRPRLCYSEGLEWKEGEATEWSQNVSWETNRWRLEESVTSFTTNTKSTPSPHPFISSDWFNLHTSPVYDTGHWVLPHLTRSSPFAVNCSSIHITTQPQHCAVSNMVCFCVLATLKAILSHGCRFSLKEGLNSLTKFAPSAQPKLSLSQCPSFV